MEVMEEGKVTVDHVTRELPRPFACDRYSESGGERGNSMLPEYQAADQLYGMYEHGISGYGI